jgi:predicted metal-dependent hydrolase
LRAKFLQARSAFHPPNHRRHARAGSRRKLHRNGANAAGRAGDQHALAQQRRAMSQCAQCGEPSHRQRRSLCEADAVGQPRHAMSSHRDALRPTEFVGQSDDARTARRTAAILRLLYHNAGHILARDPALPVVADRAQLAAIQRERMNRNQRLVALWLRFRQFPQLNRHRVVQCSDETKHQIALPCNSAR